MFKKSSPYPRSQRVYSYVFFPKSLIVLAVTFRSITVGGGAGQKGRGTAEAGPQGRGRDARPGRWGRRAAVRQRGRAARGGSETAGAGLRAVKCQAKV